MLYSFESRELTKLFYRALSGVAIPVSRHLSNGKALGKTLGSDLNIEILSYTIQ